MTIYEKLDNRYNKRELDGKEMPVSQFLAEIDRIPYHAVNLIRKDGTIIYGLKRDQIEQYSDCVGEFYIIEDDFGFEIDYGPVIEKLLYYTIREN